MKTSTIAFSLLFTLAAAAADPQMQMHRVQATTQDPSGWYLAASTQGNFSVLVPIPFNDFTVIAEDPQAGTIKTHTVGAKSSEGIKFSATATPIIKGKSPADLADVPRQLQKSGQTVSDIDPSPLAGYPSVSFSVKGSSSGARMRYVKTPEFILVVILEYPLDQAKTAAQLAPTFLSSPKIGKPGSNPPGNAR